MLRAALTNSQPQVINLETSIIWLEVSNGVFMKKSLQMLIVFMGIANSTPVPKLPLMLFISSMNLLTHMVYLIIL